MKTKTLVTKNSMTGSPSRHGLFLTAFVLACFVLPPQARAVCRQDCDLSGGNTFLGDDALVNNTTGVANTAIGASALSSNTEGTSNTATGSFALSSNIRGFENTATGVEALLRNTTGNANTGTGFSALFHNKSGNSNTAIGANAIFDNNRGQHNTAVGFNALHGNQAASFNIALGSNAGAELSSGDDNIDIGNGGRPDGASTIRIGTPPHQTNTYIAGIRGVTVAGGVGVVIDLHGHLGTVVSSERYKESVKPMDKASEAIVALKPVTFRYEHDLDPEGIPQFGLVAEDVEKVNPDLVARDSDGKPFTVRYDAVNAMLLNEFLKEHRKVEEQQKEIEALASKLQKVSNEIELLKPKLRVVEN